MLELVKHPHPALTTAAEPVPDGENVKDLIAGMRFVMEKGDYRGPGLGLAANQVGVLQRVIVVSVGSFKKALINPVIVRSYGGKGGYKEGCLSFPGELKMIVRPKQITVEAFEQLEGRWKPVTYRLKKMAARVVQHEVDHLNGVTILGDRDGHN